LVLAFKIAIKLESEITEVFEYNIMDNNWFLDEIGIKYYWYRIIRGGNKNEKIFYIRISNWRTSW
jgi:hypothetical protein